MSQRFDDWNETSPGAQPNASVDKLVNAHVRFENAGFVDGDDPIENRIEARRARRIGNHVGIAVGQDCELRAALL